VAELSTESVSSPSVPDWLSAACRSQGPLPYSSAALRDRLQGIDNVNDGALPHAVAVRFKQEIWADAHETRDSISLISYASCLGLSPVISAKLHSKCASQPRIAKNSLKPLYWGFKVVQGHRCWYPRKLVSSAGYDMQPVGVYVQPFSC